MSRVLRGRVDEFDRDVGLGFVRDDSGVAYPFHCIEIADGSRDIAVDTDVSFLVRARFGRHEATHVTAH